LRTVQDAVPHGIARMSRCVNDAIRRRHRPAPGQIFHGSPSVFVQWLWYASKTGKLSDDGTKVTLRSSSIHVDFATKSLSRKVFSGSRARQRSSTSSHSRRFIEPKLSTKVSTKPSTKT
jgi:hypothetical protein